MLYKVQGSSYFCLKYRKYGKNNYISGSVKGEESNDTRIIKG